LVSRVKRIRRVIFSATIVSTMVLYVAACSEDSAPLAPALACTQNVVPLSELDIEPVVSQRIQPIYPYQARQINWTGDATASLVVNSGGTVCEVSIVATSGRQDVDESVLSALSQWIYEPGMLDGVARRTKVEFTVEFRLSS
jgi:protein TonB